MCFCFLIFKVGVCIFVFLLVRSVCGFSYSSSSGWCLDFRLSACKASVCIFVFLLVRLMSAFSSSYLSGWFVDFRVPTCKVGVCQDYSL